MFKKITLFVTGIALSVGASAQCPTVTCPGNITVTKDPGVCGAVVTFTPPVGTDPCYSVPVTQSFSYTGSAQTWTVPPGVTSIIVDAKGAGGGGSNSFGTIQTSHAPGIGGRTQATLAVTPGQVLNIYVGQKGSDGSTSSNSTGGWNGGGNGSVYNPYYGGGAGGGATDIRIGGTALSNRVIVAGGGGGAAYNYSSGDYGGNGGGLSGIAGASNNNNSNGWGGGGGTQSAGGAGGTYTSPQGSPGQLGIGGAGAATSCSGGGGGGGYYGGGGGGWTGGGGGSGYASPTLATAVSHTTGGGNTTNGSLTITYTPQAVTAQTAGLPSGSLFPIGTTTNTFVTTGGNSATATCSFTVTVVNPNQPAITVQPIDSQRLCVGGNVTLSATAVNVGSYQWFCNGVAVPNGGNVTGATSATLSITNITSTQFGTYVLRTTSPCDVIWSDSSYVLFSNPASITSQPQATQNICVGNTITVNASVADAASVQWYKNGSPLNNGGDVSGVTTNSLSIMNADATDIGAYTLVATGFSACASATSNASNVNVNPAVAIVGVPPANISMCSGGPVLIDVIANGANGYQWYKNGVALSNGGDVNGATSANLVINNSDATDAGTYHVVVLANAGCVNAVVPSTSVAINNTPTIVAQPQATQQVCAGTNLICNVVAVDGTGYQWYKNGIPLTNTGNISGANSAILQVTGTSTNDAGNYSVQISPQSGCPPLLSTASAVTINPNASIIVPPVPVVNVCEGNAVMLNVTAGAAGSYQWYYNGNALPNGLGVSGATTPNLRIANTDMLDAGTYHVLITAYYTGCAGVVSTNSQVNITPLAANLAPNTATETLTPHVDGIGHIYTGGACDPIVKVEDAPGGNALGTTTAWVTIDPGVQEYNDQPYVTRHVDVVPGSSGLATVTLYASQADFDQYNAYIPVGAPPLPTGGINNGNVMVMQFHGTGTVPGNYTGPMEVLTPTSVTWNGNWYEIKLLVGGFSGFYIFSDLGPLSIKVVDIKAQNAGTTNIVKWSTSSEDAACTFAVERSTDGITFEELGRVNGKGKASDYNFSDREAVTGMNYYRVRLLEAAGRTSYTAVVSAKVSEGGAFDMHAYPNPVTDKVSVKLSQQAGQGAMIEVVDYTGKQLSTQPVNGMNAEIDMSSLPAGIYLIRYAENEIRHTIKVSKQ